jgi:hypothetical protein
MCIMLLLLALRRLLRLHSCTEIFFCARWSCLHAHVRAWCGVVFFFLSWRRPSPRRYRGREHAFSFGISLSFCRGGNSLAAFLSPLVAKQYGVAASQWLGAGVCLLCVLCTIPLIILDVQAERKIKADRMGE